MEKLRPDSLVVPAQGHLDLLHSGIYPGVVVPGSSDKQDLGGAADLGGLSLLLATASQPPGAGPDAGGC